MEYHAYQKRFANALTHLDEAQVFFKDEKQNRAALAIYRNNVMYSLREVLSADFPVIKKLLGEALFNQVAQDFVRHHLPQQADLSCYGANFAQFLKSRPALKDYPYLPDVATLEMACRQSFYAEKEPPLDPQKLKQLNDEALAAQVFCRRAAVILLELDWAADEIWQAHQQAEMPENMPVLHLEPQRINLLIAPDNERRYRYFSPRFSTRFIFV